MTGERRALGPYRSWRAALIASWLCLGALCVVACGGSAVVDGGASGSGGSAGAGAGAGTAGALLPVCPGAAPLSAHTPRCRTSADCADIGICLAPGTQSCGLSDAQCQTDPDCGAGQICVMSTEPCGGRICVPGCSTTPCAVGDVCGAGGRCQAVPCGTAYACPAGSQCKAGIGADAHGCSVPRCDATGTCPVNFACDPSSTTPDGCVPRSCTSDADCDCGACVYEVCEKELYVCGPANL
jgi:hypothetical protein